ncbi:MAG: hypothetical protein WCT24_00275 [Patescibacteria group bacterium]
MQTLSLIFSLFYVALSIFVVWWLRRRIDALTRERDETKKMAEDLARALVNKMKGHPVHERVSVPGESASTETHRVFAGETFSKDFVYIVAVCKDEVCTSASASRQLTI